MVNGPKGQGQTNEDWSSSQAANTLKDTQRYSSERCAGDILGKLYMSPQISSKRHMAFTQSIFSLTCLSMIAPFQVFVVCALGDVGDQYQLIS